MKTILTTINAKYIHTSLGLRWLYVVNKGRFDISFREYTLREDVKTISGEIIETGCDVVGISVSIWNAEKSRLLSLLLKKQNPKIIIIAGGPEVSYEPGYFLKNWEIDYVVSGEGEFVLGELLDALKNEKEVEIAGVSSKTKISKITVKADIEKLLSYPSPYQLEEDRKEMKNRLIYFETSRGCPYRCQYCLSSLEKGVRYFPQEYIAENLKYIIESDVRQVKFLDRTFNLNKRHTAFVFNFLLKNYRPNLSFQFEIYADLLNEAMIDFLNDNVPENYFRFEIGVQSTHEPTNISVMRKQDFPLLAHNIRRLMDGGKIDLHLDLIAGLPHENYERFVKSFNDVFGLGAKEVQLGFLKLLRGTALRKRASAFGYVYDEKPPYEVISNNNISKLELDRIRDAEHALEKFWNSGRFTRTMNRLVSGEYKERYFELFDEIGQFYNTRKLPHSAYQLEDLFRYLNQFLQSKNIDASATLRDDYYSNFTIRPTGYWTDRIDKKSRRKLLRAIAQNEEFLQENGLTGRVIEKQTAIDRLENGKYLLTVYLENERKQLEYQMDKMDLK
ncbi:MAG: DUF4080 domain-containing protein [Mariniphaga sp.]|jgi:radical SAM superfamily enzyme YgiQ (UPF0313 family)|nr:DUF4080 domain-containing protein [Mariniphaga sp.]